MFELSVEEKNLIQKAFVELIEGLPKYIHKPERDMIRKAYQFALKAHGGEKRKSGEPYILHPIAVAKIVSVEIGLGAKSIASALLHDVAEDTEYTLDDIEREFGTKIKNVIDGLTKITGAFDRNSTLQASTFRKILLTLSEDIRVILIKLADRLHNMRTLQALPRVKQIKIAGETLYLYAPLAHRLGLFTIKTELEDLSLKYKNPEVYNDLSNKLSYNEKISAHFIKKFIEPIEAKLEEQKFKYEITGRPKSIYSVWHKMQTKSIPFEQVFDLFAIRIVFKPKPRIVEKTQCWFIYSLVTDIYNVKPDRIRDWVSHPKANGYEALHATVMGPHGKWIEVQIRSDRMDDIAERGFAAHWKYKTGESQESELDKWIKKVSEMLHQQDTNDFEFLEDFKLNLFENEILTFTPKGKEILLPKDATTLDFAYDIHTQIGNKAIGAKINHKLVPLSKPLHPGDQVEILTSDIQTPQLEWLEFVKTAKAKSSIKSAFKDQRKLEISKGQQWLEEKLKEINYRPGTSVFRKLFEEFGITAKDDLYQRIGRQEITLDNLKKILKKRSKSKQVKFWGLQLFTPKEDTGTEGNDKKSNMVELREDREEKNFRLSDCCEPIPGDEILSFIDPETSEIVVHKSNCPMAIRLVSSKAEQMVDAKWTTHKVMAYLARIHINGIDRIGLVNEITNIISKEIHVNIRSMVIDSHDGIFEGNFDLYVHNTKDVEYLIDQLNKIKGVDTVKRLEKSEDV